MYWSVLVIQSCLTLLNPMDCSLPGSSIHGNLQARILEWVAIPFSRGSSWPRDWSWVSCIAGRFFTIWATRETWMYWKCIPKTSLPQVSKFHYRTVSFNRASEPLESSFKVHFLSRHLLSSSWLITHLLISHIYRIHRNLPNVLTYIISFNPAILCGITFPF